MILIYAIFNEARALRLFFLPEKLLKCLRSSDFHLLCELISEWFCQGKPDSRCPRAVVRTDLLCALCDSGFQVIAVQ